MTLLKLLVSLDRESFESVVVSLTDLGEIGKRIEEEGVPVIALNMRSGVPNPMGMIKLIREIKKYKPDVVQTWMYHADLLGGLAAKLSGVKNIVWNIRNSDLDPDKTRMHTRLTVKLCAFLSHWAPKKIISNSNKAIEIHQQAGYQKDKLMIIPNGFDLNQFCPDITAKKSVYAEFEITENTYLVGLVGRFDPQKDHKGFIEAARVLKNKINNVSFLLCGSGIDSENIKLTAWIKDANLESSFYLAGMRSDIPRLTAALDVACSSSSYGEAFPNVIGEAMACGIPCVVTDVGDSALIVGDTGKVVPPDDPKALADAFGQVLSMTDHDKQVLAKTARKRVEDNYSIKVVVDQYAQLYQLLAG